MLDKFKDECGVFGIFGHHEAANMTYLGLYALQHRGQESAGIAASDGERIRVHKEMGYVADVFDGPTLAELPGRASIGHVRYSTAGESRLANAQPFLIDCTHGQISICHNGNLVNADSLRNDPSARIDPSVGQRYGSRPSPRRLRGRKRGAWRRRSSIW